MSCDNPSSSTETSSNNDKTSVKLRVDIIDTAQKFLLNPRVRGTPIADQKNFLREKGLTEAEIQNVYDNLPANVQPQELSHASSSSTVQPNHSYFVQQPRNNRVVNALQTAVIFGGASYMAYKFVRSWLLPKFFDIPDPEQEHIETLEEQVSDLQNSTKFLMDKLVQTLETVSAQQEQLDRALLVLSSNEPTKSHDYERLHRDIGIVKSLLLNQNQFPPIPIHLGKKAQTEHNLSTTENGVSKNSITHSNGFIDESSDVIEENSV